MGMGLCADVVGEEGEGGEGGGKHESFCVVPDELGCLAKHGSDKYL